MNNIGSRFLVSALFLWLGGAGALMAGPVLTLTPPSGLAGSPGSTVGWGFTITNDVGYIEITSAQYCVDPVNFPLVCNASSLGTFADFISGFNDIIVGPVGAVDDPSIVSQIFDPILHMGIGSFAIDPGALIGDGDVGQIVLTYTLTDLDPNTSGAQILGTDLTLSAAAGTNVESATPEPSTAGQLAAALMAIAVPWLWNRKRAKA